MTTESLFQPCIIVRDDGTITIDFADSYVNTVDEDSDPVEVTYDEPEGQPHSTLLDGILMVRDVGTPQALRNLADYIETH